MNVLSRAYQTDGLEALIEQSQTLDAIISAFADNRNLYPETFISGLSKLK